MFIRTTLASLALVATATTAFAGGSAQHSDQAAYHSGEAASHAGSAAVSGVATVASVPIVVVGSALAVTGAALEEVGTSTINAGVGMSAASQPAQTGTACYTAGFDAPAYNGPLKPCMAAGPAPKLD